MGYPIDLAIPVIPIGAEKFSETRQKMTQKTHNTDTKHIPAFHHTLGGVVAGCGTTTLLFPVDLIKTRFQAQVLSKLSHSNMIGMYFMIKHCISVP